MKTISLFSFLFLTIRLFCQVPTAGLVGYWPFDNNGNDLSGNANHGMVYGATPVPDRFNVANRAYYFNGTTNSVVVNNAASINASNLGNFSFAFWIKTPPNPNLDGLPVSKNLYGSWSGYQFFTNNTNAGYCTTAGHLSFITAGSAFQDACSNNPIVDGTSPNWHFITGVYTGSIQSTSLYVDTVLQTDIGSIAGTLSNTVNLVFGAHPSAVQYFMGTLDGARMYTTSLTSAEISQLYHECDAPPAPIALTSGSVICAGSTTLSASAAGTISWYASNTSTNALATGSVFTTPVLSPGTYTFYAQSKTCGPSLSRTAITVTVSTCTSIQKSNEVLSRTTIFPNPFKENFSLLATDKMDCNIYDLVGELVFSTKITEGLNQIPMKEFSSGIYFLHLQNDESRRTLRLIKE